jgi:hypothetical protein
MAEKGGLILPLGNKVGLKEKGEGEIDGLERENLNILNDLLIVSRTIHPSQPLNVN